VLTRWRNTAFPIIVRAKSSPSFASCGTAQNFGLNRDTRGSSALRGTSVLRILHSADVRAGHSWFSRTLGVSAKSMAVPWRPARGRGRGRVGSQVLYFLRGSYGRGVARFVRYADRSGAGHLLTRDQLPPTLPSSLIRDSARLRPAFKYSLSRGTREPLRTSTRGRFESQFRVGLRDDR